MNVEELFKEGFLKKIAPSKERAQKSVKKSEMYLSEAQQTMNLGINNLAIIAAYSSVFHAARAILFIEGVAERSHFAIVEYLREKHKDFGEDMINAFDIYRKLRHSVAYDLDTKVSKKDAENIIEFAEDFLEKVKKHLRM